MWQFMKVVPTIFGFLWFIPVLLASPVAAAPLCDYDGDGLSDVLFADGASITVGSPLLLEETKSPFTSDLATDIPFLAPSRKGTYTNLETIRDSEGATTLLWRRYLEDGTRELRYFGEPGHTFLVGGNVTNDLAGDVVEVYPEGSSLVWRIHADIFGRRPRVRDPLPFGRGGDRVFLSRFGSRTRQRLGIFGPFSKLHARAAVMSVDTGRISTFRRFPASLAKGERPRPMSIKDQKGREALLFPSTNETDTILVIYSMRGKRLGRVVIPQKGNVLVGEFDATRKGEEIVLHTVTNEGGKMTVISPFAPAKITVVQDTPSETVVPRGTVMPCLGTLRIPGAEAEPTPTPTPVPTTAAFRSTAQHPPR